MSQTVTVGGEPFQYEAEAEAGIVLATSERWWGTRVRWRPGTTGRWRHGVVRDVHPFAHAEVRDAVAALIRRHYGVTA
jgi:hypothetical protein